MSEPLTIDEVRVFMDPYFTGIIVEGFGLGIYTLLFFQAIWKLRKKRNTLFALVLLWILSMFNFVAECSFSRAAFIFHNSSPTAIFTRLDTGLNRFMYIPFIMAMLTSDAILIWRCHELWRNKAILIILITFLTTTAGLMLSDAFLVIPRLNFLLGSLAVLSSFITTVSTTSLIALKIALVTRRNRMRYSYAKIIEILVESAAIVSVVSLGTMITELVLYMHPYDLRTVSGRTSYQVLQYLTAINSSVIGIGPTLTAFRAASQRSQTEVDQPQQTSALSRLIFKKTIDASSSYNYTQALPLSRIRFGTGHAGESDGSSVRSFVDLEAGMASARNEMDQCCSKYMLGSIKGSDAEFV